MSRRSALTALVADFDDDVVNNRKRIAEILQSQPEAFYFATVEILKKDVDSRAVQYLMTLLVSHGLLFPALCDPGLDRAKAVAVARQAFRVDPLIDTKLARQLAEASTATDGQLGADMACRLMDMLDEISDVRRILPSLMRILRSDNPHVRSKAVLMIGRSRHSLNWIERRLQEADTRVRANAIEAMWGVETAEARALLEWATHDENNRVVGNALLGLYKLGETSSLADLLKMAGDDSEAFRRTAAWVMGATADPRFREVLGHMIADCNRDVRKSAFAAVGRIRVGVTKVAQTGEWLVAGSCSAADVRTGERSVSVAVSSAEGREVLKLLPVQFQLSETVSPVWSYRVMEKPQADGLSVRFLFPRRLERAGRVWEQAAMRCLQWKRSGDFWSAAHYLGKDDCPTAGAEFALPLSLADEAQAARAFQEMPSRTDCTGFWAAMQDALSAHAPIRAKRHIVVLAPEEVGDGADETLIETARDSRTFVQVVSAASNDSLREFCDRTDGRFYLAKDETEIEKSILLAYLVWLPRYEIRYQSAAGARLLKLRVHTPSGWGETVLPLPASSQCAHDVRNNNPGK